MTLMRRLFRCHFRRAFCPYGSTYSLRATWSGLRYRSMGRIYGSKPARLGTRESCIARPGVHENGMVVPTVVVGICTVTYWYTGTRYLPALHAGPRALQVNVMYNTSGIQACLLFFLLFFLFFLFLSSGGLVKMKLNPCRTAAPLWGRTRLILSTSSPKRGCGANISTFSCRVSI